ncbi:winged helix-turn-helix transcriptional regulator [Nonomuraea composti]|uniref:winged helix-turn-helix transcriptional regulator n=1 Tax=Nonomuraea composti TaxID=2720023 RepID=UPI001F0E032D|nr:winged helix-turn-helix transcriptional regulator [Nonomuraea sp. FMUSA5-5]
MERHPYQTHPVRHEYVLTDLGRSLRPVIVAMAAWGNDSDAYVFAAGPAAGPAVRARYPRDTAPERIGGR